MPATSQQQQKLMGIVHALQKGDIKPSSVSKKAQSMAKSMKPGDVTDFAGTKHKGLPKKVKKENMGVASMYVVRKPHADMKEADLVMELNPLEGIQPLNIMQDDVMSVHHDETEARRIAAEAYKNCMDEAFQLEEKKGKVGDKLKKAIDQLEKKRKEHVDMAKEDPKNASKHKEHIAKLATQIDDLMSKMEKIEKSKKSVENKEDEKEDKKQNLKEADEPGSPERLVLGIKNQLVALINAARKTLNTSEQPPYFDSAKGDYASNEIDNIADNLTLLINVCHHFIPEDSNNLQTVRSMKMALAKRGDQKMDTTPPMPPKKALPIPGVTGKTNFGKPPVPPTKSATSSVPPTRSAPPPLPTKK